MISSLGEYAALAVANVLTLKGALMIIANQSRYMIQKCAVDSTSMLAVHLPSLDIQNIINSSGEFSEVSIACINSSVDNVLAGPISQLRTLKSHLDAHVHCKNVLLPAPFGFHSSAMEPLVEDLRELCKCININAPSIPVISNVFGSLVLPGDASVFDAGYFARHCSEPLQFAKGIQDLFASATVSEIDAWIEIGPHTATFLMLKNIAQVPKSALFLGSLDEQQESWSMLTATLSQLYTTNAPIRWRDVFSHISASCVSFVTYPFSTTKFWVPFTEDSPASVHSPAIASPSRPPPVRLSTGFDLLGAWSQFPTKENGQIAIFETPISQLASSIRGHSVGGRPLCPASVYLEQVFAGLKLAYEKLSIPSSGEHVILRSIEFAKPLVYHEEVSRTVITNITIGSDGSGKFFVASRVDGSSEESVHVHGRFKTEMLSRTQTKFHRTLPVVNRHTEAVIKPKNGKTPQFFSTRTAYEIIFPRVVDYAKEYRTMQSITVDSTNMEAYASVKLPASHGHGRFIVHPVFIDTLLHVAGFVANMHGSVNDAYICREVESVKVIPEQVDNNASYGIYCSNGWLPDKGVMLAETYAIKLSEPPVLVAHLRGMHFKKVRLTSLKKGLELASGKLGTEYRRAPSPSRSLPTRAVQKPSMSVASSVSITPSVPVVHDRFERELQSGMSSPRTLVADESLPEPAPFAVDDDVDIRSILATILDVSPKDIDLDLDLESFGLDSLTSIEALAALKTKFKLDLPGAFFNHHRTAREIQSYLSLQISTAKMQNSPRAMKQSVHNSARDIVTYNVSPPKVTVPEPDFSVKIPAASATRLTKALKLDTIPLPLQKSAFKALPLFLIHDGSGLINYYNGITSLERQVWGFNNPHFISSEPWSGVPAMASAYAKYISNITTGPVILGGEHGSK